MTTFFLYFRFFRDNVVIVKYLKYYRRLQNSKAFAGLEVGHAKMFNFSPNVYKLSNSISRGSGDSSDSNYTKYINYGCKTREKIGAVFPYPREPGKFFCVAKLLGSFSYHAPNTWRLRRLNF
jgi:hypothetical protein